MMCPFRSLLILSMIAASVVGRPGHQNQAPGALGQLGDDRRQPQLLERSHIERNHADYHGHTAPLLEHVPAEAGQVLDPEAKVKLVFGFEPLLLILGEYRVGQLQGVFAVEDFGNGAVRDVPINPQLGPLGGGDVKVGGLFLDHFLEQGPQIDGHPALSLTTSSRVVTPLSIFFIPSIRRVSIPSTTACVCSSATDAPRKIMRRSSGESAMTS